MYNEIIRKITSLTLMTIMLAGGMTIAFPGFTPDAYAVNANLIVSAENTGGFVDGAQIVEILIIDDDLSGLPDVTINGDAVAMTATTDGNWYAYIADTDAVAGVDNDGNTSGIDFGDNNACDAIVTDSTDVYCTNGTQNVPASVKTSKTGNNWPFIQTYAFQPNIEIRYNHGGEPQISNLEFDDNAGGLSLDRSDYYPQGAQVHVTIDDHRLNIDPTSSESWTWNLDTGDKYYGVTGDTEVDIDVRQADTTAELKIAEGERDTERTALSRVQAAFTTAQTALTTAITDAEPELGNAKAELTAKENLFIFVNATHDTAQEELATANEALESAKGNLTTANFNLIEAEFVYKTSSIDLAIDLALKYSEATQSILNDANVAAANIKIAFDSSNQNSTYTVAKDGANAVVTAIGAYADTTARIHANIQTEISVTNLDNAKTAYDNAITEAGQLGGYATTVSAVNTYPSVATSNHQTAVTTAQEAVNAAPEAVNAARVDIDAAKIIVGTAQDAVDAAQEAVDAARVDIDAAKIIVGKAQEAVTTAQEAVTTAQEAVTTAQEAVDAAQDAFDAANSKVIEIESALGGIIDSNSIDLLKTNAVCSDCSIEIDFIGQGSVNVVKIEEVDKRPIPVANQEWFTVREVGGPNTAVFSGTNLSDESILTVTDDAPRDSSATITYDGDTTGIFVKYSEATIDIQSPDDVWTSGLAIPIAIVDGDVNKNSQASDDVELTNPDSIIPTLVTGDPFTLGETSSSLVTWIDDDGTLEANSAEVEPFSQRAILSFDKSYNNADYLVIDIEGGFAQLKDTLIDRSDDLETGYNFLNYNVESLGADVVSIDILVDKAPATTIDNLNDQSGYVAALNDLSVLPDSGDLLQLKLNFAADGLTVEEGKGYPIVIDFFSFGYENDGEASDERIANQIIRLLLEESDDNTASLEGTLEYIMINQLNIDDEATYAGLTTVDLDVSFIVIEDLTGSSAPSVTYLDVDTTGTKTQVSAQEDAPSHSAVVSLDVDSFKTADTVTVTLEDLDLNTDSGLKDIYTVVSDSADPNYDTVGKAGSPIGRMLEITFDDQRWMKQIDAEGLLCTPKLNDHAGLGATGFKLVETGDATGIFIGTFAIPAEFCREGEKDPESVTGLDIEVNYVDFRDASGETTEVGDSAGVKANTGSVSLDRTVYPVPFGVTSDFTSSSSTTPSESNAKTRSLFPIHQSGMNDKSGLQAGEFLPQGDLIVYVTVTDPDFDVSASGRDSIAIAPCYVIPKDNDSECKAEKTTTYSEEVDRSPVTISVIRGSEDVTIDRIGGSDSPIDEIAPDAGIFESSVTLRYNMGPDSSLCPSTGEDFDVKYNSDGVVIPSDDSCILQGDILQVEYIDPTDASGQPNSVTDSATFDLRNGVLQSDKSVYIIGSDMILTLIEPDFDLDSSQNETYDLDLIKWSSSAATVTMGDADGEIDAFDPEPLSFRETGPSTGIFQIVIEIPQELDNSLLQRGEEIDLEYTDWGPSGSDYVGDEDEDVRLTVFTSNFGATIDLDQKVYSWTDKVYITVVAPDHNFDNNLIDEIGETDEDPLRVATKGFDLDNYRLVETGFDTGIFTGEVILTGFAHDPTGDGNKVVPRTSGNGPTDGYLQTPESGGISVSYEFSEDETVFTSSIIRWNIGDVQWLEASYPASGTGVLRVIDPDMNLNPEAVDNFDVNIASNTDASGITLTVTETNEATGIFEGTVFFTTTGGSSGHRLRVSEGDTVTADYADGTLPLPYTVNDSVSITSTTIIGTIVPPLERAPATNLRIVDAFGSSIDAVFCIS